MEITYGTHCFNLSTSRNPWPGRPFIGFRAAKGALMARAEPELGRNQIGERTRDEPGGMVLPEDIETSPRWRWPIGFDKRQKPSRSPRTKSPFDLFSLSAQPDSKKKQGNHAKPSSSRSTNVEEKPSISGLAGRLFNNPRIQSLAKADLRASETAFEDNAASALRDAPNAEDITDIREFRRQYAQWIEGKRKARERARFNRQEGEIWVLVRGYLIVSIFLILIAVISMR